MSTRAAKQRRHLLIRLSVLFFMLSLVLIGTCFFIPYEVNGFVAERGTIIGSVETTCYERSANGKRSIKVQCWRPTISYRVRKGLTNHISALNASSSIPDIGADVPILVNPNNRMQAISGRKIWHFLLSFGLSIIGMGILVRSVVMSIRAFSQPK